MIVKTWKSGGKHAILLWVVCMAFLLTVWDQISVSLGFVLRWTGRNYCWYSQIGVSFQNLWPNRCKEMCLQNCYFISHTPLKERKRTDAAALISGPYIFFNCVLRYDEDWSLLQVTFSCFFWNFHSILLLLLAFPLTYVYLSFCPSARHVATRHWMPCLPHQSNLPSRFCSFSCTLSDNVNHIISPRTGDFSFSLYQGGTFVM